MITHRKLNVFNHLQSYFFHPFKNPLTSKIYLLLRLSSSHSPFHFPILQHLPIRIQTTTSRQGRMKSADLFLVLGLAALAMANQTSSDTSEKDVEPHYIITMGHGTGTGLCVSGLLAVILGFLDE
ncbi:hypothetical protein BDZ45DRAFT_797427 [Acephala macrosclerotiorum]|nr:hypothetical protein BDZ45DRAFT_797427 [Acephala macrosclerotiorum]